MNIEEAREFYLDMGGNYADDIVRLGNEFDLVEAGLRLKSLANYSRSNSSSVNESKNSSQRLLRRCTAEPSYESCSWGKPPRPHAPDAPWGRRAAVTVDNI